MPITGTAVPLAAGIALDGNRLVVADDAGLSVVELSDDAGHATLVERSATVVPQHRRRDGRGRPLSGRQPRGPGAAAGHGLQRAARVRPDAQVELAAAGERMRVYVPYGTQRYGYFMRRLAERPANVAFFLRALASRG